MAPLEPLAPDQRAVVSLVLQQGRSYDEIAAMLGISERTVKCHVSNLYRKLGQENRIQLALMSRQFGRPTA